MDNLGFEDSGIYLTKYKRNQEQDSFTNLTPTFKHKKNEPEEIKENSNTQKNTSKVSTLQILVPILLVLFVKIFPQWFDTLSDSIWIKTLSQFGSQRLNFSVTRYQDFVWVTEDCTDVQWLDDKWINTSIDWKNEKWDKWINKSIDWKSDKWTKKTIDWKTHISATTDNKCSSFSLGDKETIEYGKKSFGSRNQTLVQCRRDYSNWAVAAAIPILVYIVSVLFLWWRDERGLAKILLLPVVLCGFYTQFRAIKLILIILGLWPNRKREDWEKEKKRFSREVASLEPVIEALPSIIIQIALLSSELEAFLLHGRPSPFGDNSRFFLLTFNLSLLMTVLGLAHFLKEGPSPFISSEGRVDGFLTFRFAALYLSIFWWFMAKGYVLMGVVYSSITQYQCYKSWFGFKIGHGILTGVFLWSATLLLPQLIHAFILLSLTTKCKVFSFCASFPSFLITPLFTPFTYEGSIIDGKYKFHVSLKHSIVNILCTFILTPLAMMLHYYVGVLKWAYNFGLTPDELEDYQSRIEKYEWRKETQAAENLKLTRGNNTKGVQFFVFLVVLLPFLLMMIATILSLVLLIKHRKLEKPNCLDTCSYKYVGTMKWEVK